MLILNGQVCFDIDIFKRVYPVCVCCCLYKDYRTKFYLTIEFTSHVVAGILAGI